MIYRLGALDCPFFFHLKICLLFLFKFNYIIYRKVQNRTHDGNRVANIQEFKLFLLKT